jgi:hypothetical protein
MNSQWPANKVGTVALARRDPRPLFYLAVLALLAFLIGAFSTSLSATSADAERGLEIATEWDLRDTGWNDQRTDLQMILRNRHGEESTRELRSRLLEVEGDGDKLLVIFDRPRDVKGTAFLTYTHRTGADDQWLYLPALKRVKRISSNNKSGPFMGSEFAYEDLASQEVGKYTYRYLRNETANHRDSFVVERIPVDKNSGYTRQIVWHDSETYRPEKIEFYDRKNELLKTLTYSKYKQYVDQYWRADELFMENHQTGKSTLLVWNQYEFQTGLSDRDFDRNSLKRAR